jgi:glutathione S-transferase
MAIDAGLAANPDNPISKMLGDKYGYGPAAAAAAPGRVVDVLRLLSKRLTEQRAAGHTYLLGGELSVLDVYWATFCNLLAPPPPDLCPIPEALRPMFTANEPEVVAALDPILLEHRDLVYERHLTLPIEL